MPATPGPGCLLHSPESAVGSSDGLARATCEPPCLRAIPLRSRPRRQSLLDELSVPRVVSYVRDQRRRSRPLLVLHGSHDGDVGTAHAYHSANTIAQARLHLVPEGWHLLRLSTNGASARIATHSFSASPDLTARRAASRALTLVRTDAANPGGVSPPASTHIVSRVIPAAGRRWVPPRRSVA